MQTQASSFESLSPQLLGMIAFGALLLFAMYRRLRRNFGRQRVLPVRMGLRIGVLAVIGAVLLPLALRSPASGFAIAGGIALGLAIGVFAAERTRFEMHASQLHYIPHTYAGIVVSSLLLARVIYRLAQLHSSGALTGAAGHPATAGGASQSTLMSPLTLGLLFLLISYNVYFGGRVLWKSRHLRPQDSESGPLPS